MDLPSIPERIPVLLKKVLYDCGKLLVCLSGGVDSVLLAVCARSTLGPTAAPAFLSISPTVPDYDQDFARRICKDYNITLIEQYTQEYDYEEYRRNDLLRCRYCKRELFRAAGEIASELKIPHIADGTVSDDLRDYRPGLIVAKELDILHPLAQAGMNKQDVRRLSRKLGIEGWDRPPSPCLSSRIAYGVPIHLEHLKIISRIENELRTLGFIECRCRVYADIIRLEVPSARVHELIFALEQRDIKFESKKPVRIDLEGLVSGKLNRMIKRLELDN